MIPRIAPLPPRVLAYHKPAGEVVTPDDYMSDCIGDLNSRRGQIQGMNARGNAQVIDAMVPLANMFGYATVVRGLSRGMATFSMEMCRYAQVPTRLAEEIVNRRREKNQQPVRK